MTFGPCGGVRPEGACEVAERLCPFLAGPLPVWAAPPALPASPPMSALLRHAAARPAVLTDLSSPPHDLPTLRRLVQIAAPATDAVLIGEHATRPDHPPHVLAGAVAAVGGRPWPTLTCRDRSRAHLEQELAQLGSVGVDAVLCVTGDGRRASSGTDSRQTFGLDGTGLTAAAVAAGLCAAVAESPQAPPRQLRPARVRSKERAGAAVCVLNHVGERDGVDAFVRAARAAGVEVPFIASVAVYTDARSAAVLAALPGLELDADRVAAVLAEPDPVAAGIAEAVREAQRLLAIDGVVGVNLSGLAADGPCERAAEIKAAVGYELLRSLSP